ncbi:MAG TPA: protein kinase [Pyrinomonadaceae bacterium]|jgi:Serine/threonine protein kinase|nr:protein kinase [Pyrinomonadaceae bacterium]
MLGKTISHYTIKSQIGEGGMGVVYEAEDINLGRHVALKFLTPAMAGDENLLQRFQREARAASSLNHPNICTIHGIEQFESDHFIVMELLDGESLADRIRRGPLDLDSVLTLGVQIVDALESAHSRGIVHRDLKPANIFVTSRSQAKILDFGLAKMDHRNRPNNSSLMPTARLDDLTMAGATMGTVAYMSPEQARGEITDARTDLFSIGTVLYQMAAGTLPFRGETSAVMFDSILNRDPTPLNEVNPSLPPELSRIIGQALEKDRDLRYQSATDLKTALKRLKRDLDSGRHLTDSSGFRSRPPSTVHEHSIAVLYFENLSGMKEDEYLRDGITEDITTELSKIKNLKTFSRAMVLAYRDKSVTAGQVGKELGASYVLVGSLRRAGTRLRINAQLVDAATDFPLWSERYDREMKDVFEVQDEIAQKIAAALRITLSPQEQQALSAKPTENLQAYDLYLRGRNYSRRVGRQDLLFALQMYENAVALDPDFALAHAGLANVCAQYYYHHERQQQWIDRAIAATQKASASGHDEPEIQCAEGWVLFANGRYDECTDKVRMALSRNPDLEGGYYLLGRSLFAAGRYQDVANIMEDALAHSGENYNTTIPIHNALGALGKKDALNNYLHREIAVYEAALKKVPEDARVRVLLAGDYAMQGRFEEAKREADTAMILRPGDTMILYNTACVFAAMKNVDESLTAIKKAWEAGFKDPTWTRQDPDLQILHGHPEFERLYPPPSV